MSAKAVAEKKEELLRRLALGETVKKICEDKHMPDYQTIFRWSQRDNDFHRAYATARDAFAQHHADACLEIADNPRGGDDDCFADVSRSDLRIKTRQWLANLYCPSRFSERRGLQIRELREKKKMSAKVNTVIDKMADGEISPEDAGKMMAAIYSGQKVILEGEKQQETEDRLTALEGKSK